jgi:hypothetical protein
VEATARQVSASRAGRLMRIGVPVAGRGRIVTQCAER